MGKRNYTHVQALLPEIIAKQPILSAQHEGADARLFLIGVTPKFCVKSNECRNRANLYVGGSGLTVCRLCLQHNAGGDGCQGRRSRSFDP